MKKTPLQVKIQALNMLNEYSEKYFALATEHFYKFLGVDIFRVDGSIKQKYVLTLPTFEGKLPDGTFFNIHAWTKNTGYVLELNIKLCINGGSHDEKPSTAFCQYENAYFDICVVRDGKLAERERQPNDFSLRYEEGDILTKAAEAEEAAKVYKNKLDKVPYQFRDILWLKNL